MNGVYHNAENGFCVLRAKARGHRDMVTVVGHAAAIAAGEWITASGEWVNDRTHGQQFKARFLRTSPPNSADGIEKYRLHVIEQAVARTLHLHQTVQLCDAQHKLRRRGSPRQGSTNPPENARRERS